MTKPADSDQIAKARRISEIAEREKKATKGPWEVVAVDDYYISAEAYPSQVARYVHDNTDKTLAMIGNQTADCGEANSKFIAHARADIPFLLSGLASERQAVIENCAKMADQIAQSCSACSYSREKPGEEPSFCENFGCSSFADLATAIRSRE